jgi:uncharacterized protein (DUF1015 family)
VAEIAPFRALRYSPERISFISRVAAPPYDLIEPEQAEVLRESDPHNVIRLILGKEGPQRRPDTEYRQAADTLAAWRREGVLVLDEAPAIYLCEQTFILDGMQHVRHGVICAMLLEEFASGRVLPHERTMAGPKADRLRLMEACRTSLSQVFGVFSDTAGRADALLRGLATDSALYEFRQADGVAFRVWRVDDAEALRELRSLLRSEIVFIADGHHRYEAALRYRDLHRPAEAPPGSVPEDFLPIFCVSVRNTGLKILPTYRLVQAPECFDAAAFQEALARRFATEVRNIPNTGALKQALRELHQEYGWIACHVRPQQLLVLKPASAKALDDVLPPRSPVWRGLPVAQLHYGILQPLFGIQAESEVAQPRLAFSQDAERMYWQVESRRYDAAFYLPPIQPATVEAIARAGERMPAKSTFFYPKICTGLAFFPFEPANCPRLAP